jgi:uncharacterized alkaline shock family protein YloU
MQSRNTSLHGDESRINTEKEAAIVSEIPLIAEASVGSAVLGCYGVAGMRCVGLFQSLRSLLHPEQQLDNKGVRIYNDGDELTVDLHVIVTQGLNMSAIIRSITNKVCCTVERSVGMKVRNVNVFVDGMLLARNAR